jgi:hypothetical protein
MEPILIRIRNHAAKAAQYLIEGLSVEEVSQKLDISLQEVIEIKKVLDQHDEEERNKKILRNNRK